MKKALWALKIVALAYAGHKAIEYGRQKVGI